MYAGAQDGSQHASSQTFTIQASAPYGVISFRPLRLDNQPYAVALVRLEGSISGGSESNNKVMVFSAASGWTDREHR